MLPRVAKKWSLLFLALSFLALGGLGLRVNKILSHRYSRREADRLVNAGRVTINGKKAIPGDTVTHADFVKLDGKRVAIPKVLFEAEIAPGALGPPETASGGKRGAKRPTPTSFVYIVYNKPKGVECTTDQRVAENIVDAVGHPERIFPVGRLDKDSTGTIILTSDGRLPDACLRAENGRTKTYQITADRPVAPEDCRKISRGVVITTTSQSSGKSSTSRTLPCEVHPIQNSGGRVLKIKLKEGRNRQIRKMLRAVGYTVKQLHRPSFMGISCRGLKPGAWRDCNEKEIKIINRALEAATMPE